MYERYQGILLFLQGLLFFHLFGCTTCDETGQGRLLLLQAPTDDCRVKIVQRGAVPPLVQMLKTQDRSLREMAAFALGRLAQNSDNQAGIFVMGAVPPLLELLDSGIKNLEHNAAFTLYGLADNVDNVPELVKCGAYERLRVAEFPDDQPTKDCIVKTLKRIAVCSLLTVCLSIAVCAHLSLIHI